MLFRNTYLVCGILLFLMVVSCQTHKKTEVQTLANNKLVVSIDITKFGALGNGKNDDTKAIQDAIDYACNLGCEAHLLFEDGKTYKITKAINIRCSYLKIDLNKSTIDATKIEIADKNEYSLVFICNGIVKYSKLLDYTDIGSNVRQRSKLIEKEVPELFVRISNNEISQRERSYYKKSEFIDIKETLKNKNNRPNSILSYTQPVLVEEIDFVKNVEILNGFINCSKLNYTIGIQFKMARNCLVKNVDINNTSVSGVAFDRSIFCHVDSCIVLSPTPDVIGLDYGILFTESQYCKATNNYLETSKTGVDLTNSHFILIEYNKTKNCGISPHAGTNITVRKNTLINGSMYFRSHKSRIIENQITISNSGLGGIVLSELYSKDSIEIKYNVIKFEDINFFKGDKGESFGHGIFSGEINLKNVTISNNHIIDANIGIAVFRANNENGNENLTILNNKIENCRDIGINASRYSNVNISNNVITCSGAKSMGISMWESGGVFENIEILNNQISNVDIGIRVTKGYKLRKIDANKVSNEKSCKIFYQYE